MFHADITFALSLIALPIGALSLLFAKKYREISTKTCIAMGYLVVALSFIMLLVSGYGMLQGYFMKKRMAGMMQQRKMMPMMQKMMKNNEMKRPMKKQGKAPTQQMKRKDKMPMHGPLPFDTSPHNPITPPQEKK